MVEATSSLGKVRRGDLLFSHSKGKPDSLPQLMLRVHETPYSHVGLYVGEGKCLDAAPKAGVIVRSLYDFVAPGAVATALPGWRGVERVAVFRHPALVAAAKVGDQERVDSLELSIVEAADWLTEYADDMLLQTQTETQQETAATRYQYLVSVLTSRDISPEEMRLACAHRSDLMEMAEAMNKGYTCSAFVANTFLQAASEGDTKDLQLDLGLQPGAALSQGSSPVPRAVTKPLDDQERAEFEGLLRALNVTLYKQLRPPQRRVMRGPAMARGRRRAFGHAPVPRIRRARMGAEIPRYLVGIHHLLHAKGMDHILDLVPDPKSSSDER
ncbi:MAG: hypothetical protein WBB15_17970 [Ornithinimicrobium sp.]